MRTPGLMGISVFQNLFLTIVKHNGILTYRLTVFFSHRVDINSEFLGMKLKTDTPNSV
jgi:hypothetical protein